MADVSLSAYGARPFDLTGCHTLSKQTVANGMHVTAGNLLLAQPKRCSRGSLNGLHLQLLHWQGPRLQPLWLQTVHLQAPNLQPLQPPHLLAPHQPPL